MKLPLRRLIPYVLLMGTALSSSPELEVIRRAAEDDDLEEWLAAAQQDLQALKPCPVLCSETKDSTSRAEWFLYSDARELASCNQTMLIDMVVQNSKAAVEDQIVARACTADYGSVVESAFIPEKDKASLCTTANRILEDVSIFLQNPTTDSDAFSPDHLVSAGHQIANHLALQKPSCNSSAMEFAYFQSSAIGLYAGAEVHQHGLSSDVLVQFLAHAQGSGLSKTTIVQLCGTNDRGADYGFGIVATSAKNLPYIQEVVKTWADGECVAQASSGEDWMQVTIRVPGPADAVSSNSTNGTTVPQNATFTNFEKRARLDVRADCKTAKVKSGDGCFAVAERCKITQANLEKYNRKNLCTTLIADEMVCCSSGTLPSTLPAGNSDGTCKTRKVVSLDTCTTLASKCGISANDFMKANAKSNLCNTLQPGQQVCCTKGTYPDLKPKPDSSGGCAVYRTKKDDSCSQVAVARDLTVNDLMSFNKNTWGWHGCSPTMFYPDFLMCVSKGTPPMPAIVPNAVCGPMMNGTVKPPSGTNISTLNPCPLNVCCNKWGQCGMTDDFCVISKAETGAPGTAAPGKNGCISNCGRDIIKGKVPASKMKVAYYESWNFNRKCLNMYVTSIPSDYTHIHFAFANVTRGNFKPEITDKRTLEEFEDFKKMKNVKRIISFGGWAFSTEPGTYRILREAVLPANREIFKNNIISFIKEHDLDGVDLDWEYPGAPDIPGIPSDDPENGLNYHRLLTSIKSAVGSSKSVSFAAPASYWYLKSFPVKEMSKALDYIIFMSYDLHGQWDYGNKWSSPGCESGNCLRSHVNETETKDALSMITKAGVDSSKVVVGVSSYGRSFKMSQAGCDSENCKFTGTSGKSNAYKGRCTNVGGYISNAEIQEIIDHGNVQKKYTKEGSNIMVFNSTEWVAWMDDKMKASRAKFYDSYNFAGTTDWAVDLQKFWAGNGGNDGGDDFGDDYEMEIDNDYWAACEGKYNSLEQLEKRKGTIPGHCMEQYIADVQIATLDGALSKYKDLLDDGYDDKFKIYERYIKAQLPDQINNFMASEKVDKYFKCKDYSSHTCCSDCRYATCHEPGQCVKGSDCKSGKGWLTLDNCPQLETIPDGFGSAKAPNATFDLTNEDGFFKDLSATWGIDKDWISFGKRQVWLHNGCQNDIEDIKDCAARNNKYFHDYPIADPRNVKIYNPKDIIGGSFKKATNMLERFEAVQVAAIWDEQMLESDMVDATSLPAYSTEEAISSMEKIVDKANDIKKKEREDFILNFIMGLLFWIPMVGEAVVGLAAVKNMARLIGGVGEAAVTIYDIVENPENAFMSVFLYLAGAGVGNGGFRKAASARRDIPKKDYDSLGNVKGKLDKVQSLRGQMCSI